jgi:two-component system, chemotaxis family, chemotaxis protein CheY
MAKVILVVDDSPTVRKFVSTALHLLGYRVITACDGMEALEKMPCEAIDVIITDLNMPDMDGFEFIRNLRSSPQYSVIPVIVLSSLTDKEEKERATNLGAFSYLEKPFTVQSIQKEILRASQSRVSICEPAILKTHEDRPNILEGSQL